MLKKNILIVAGIYLVCMFIFTYPMVFRADSHIYNGRGDPVSINNVMFWNNYNIFHGESNIFKLRQFFPLESESLAHDMIIGNQLIYAPAYALSHNTIFATNMVVLTSFLLSALSMFLLAYYWTRNALVSFICGFIFGFSPLRLGNSQIQFMTIYWIPVFFIFFDRFLRCKKTKDIILSSVIFSFQALYSWYITHMFILCILCYFITFIIIHRKTFKIKEYVLKSFAGVVIILLLIGPFAYHYYKISKTHSFKHPLGTAAQYSASFPDDYFLARDINLIFGKFRFERPVVESLPLEKELFSALVKLLGNKVNYFGAERLPGDTAEERLTFERFSGIINRQSTEKNLFLGMLPFVLGIMGFIHFRRKKERPLSEMTKLFLWVGILFFVLSFGPFLIMFGHFTYVPLPYLLLYYVFPAFNIMRVPARMAYMVMFSLSILSGAGLVYLLEKFKDKRKRIYIITGVIVILVLESVTIPVKMVDIKTGDEIPEVYGWLRDVRIEGGVAEVPSVKGTLSKYDMEYGERRGEFIDREIMYIYYTTYHLKPIINGVATFYPDSYFEITQCLNNISEPESVRTLKEYNVNLFIVHKDYFDEEDKLIWSEENIAKAGLEKVKEFGSDVVYTWATREEIKK